MSIGVQRMIDPLSCRTSPIQPPNQTIQLCHFFLPFFFFTPPPVEGAGVLDDLEPVAIGE